MAQVLFATDTTPSLVDLDANFLELYNRSEGIPGIWTATGTGVANIDSVTPTTGIYFRSGGIVVAVTRVAVDPTAATTFTSFRLSLPVASTLTSSANVIGVATRNSISQASAAGFVSADTTNSEALVQFYNDAQTGSLNWSIIFMYRVL